MNAANKLSAVLSLCIMSASAQAVDFSFLSNPVTPEAFGNSLVMTQQNLTLTATAWSTTGSGNTFQTAELEIYSGYGMGVCNRIEGVNCSNTGNSHALDNAGADDLILFKFSNAVRLDTLNLLQFGGDSDLSLWAGTGTLNLTGKTASGLGTATLITNSNSQNTSRTITLGSTLNGQYDWLAVAARIGQENDYAKLRALTVDPVAAPVPEAESWAMLLAGLGLVGFAVRRRA